MPPTTQAAFARRHGVSTKTVTHRESGKPVRSVGTIVGTGAVR